MAKTKKWPAFSTFIRNLEVGAIYRYCWVAKPRDLEFLGVGKVPLPSNDRIAIFRYVDTGEIEAINQKYYDVFRDGEAFDEEAFMICVERAVPPVEELLSLLQ